MPALCGVGTPPSLPYEYVLYVSFDIPPHNPTPPKLPQTHSWKSKYMKSKKWYVFVSHYDFGAMSKAPAVINEKKVKGV